MPIDRHQLFRWRRTPYKYSKSMGIKKYFTGKTGVIFWFNVLLAIGVLVCVPTLIFNSLDKYTNHGEKVSVPSVVGKSAYEAESMLGDKGFVAVISDSTFKKGAQPGAVLDQNPKAGSLIKSGRIVYLSINLFGEPLVKVPDLAHNCSMREAEIKLKSLGFKLTAPQYVVGQDKDMVLMVKQGRREVKGGDMVSKERALTLYVGAGEEEADTISFDDEAIHNADDVSELEVHESNFDIQL